MKLQKETLRETVPADDGRVAVILNVSYPTAKGKKYKSFCTFYKQGAEAFCEFARGDLKAKAAQNPEGTPPCGAVLKFESAEETDAVAVTLYFIAVNYNKAVVSKAGKLVISVLGNNNGIFIGRNSVYCYFFNRSCDIRTFVVAF